MAHGKCSRLVITDGDEEEEEEMFPASRTNCPVCPGLMGFPGGRTFSTKARKSQANLHTEAIILVYAGVELLLLCAGLVGIWHQGLEEAQGFVLIYTR